MAHPLLSSEAGTFPGQIWPYAQPRTSSYTAPTAAEDPFKPPPPPRAPGERSPILPAVSNPSYSCDRPGETSNVSTWCPTFGCSTWPSDDDTQHQQQTTPRQEHFSIPDTDVVTCWYCHERGHIYKYCPGNPDCPTCFNCLKLGHIARNCPSFSCPTCMQSDHHASRECRNGGALSEQTASAPTGDRPPGRSRSRSGRRR